MEKTEIITQVEFAKRSGVKPQTVSYLIGKGRLATTVVNGRRMIDWKSQKTIYQRIRRGSGRTEPTTENESSDPDESSVGSAEGPINNIADARLQREKYAALKVKEEYQVLSGKSINLDEIEKEWANLGSALKKSLMSLPARIGPLLAGESNPHKTSLMLKREIIKCLKDTVGRYRASPESEPIEIEEDEPPVILKEKKKVPGKKKVIKKSKKKKVVKK